MKNQTESLSNVLMNMAKRSMTFLTCNLSLPLSPAQASCLSLGDINSSSLFRLHLIHLAKLLNTGINILYRKGCKNVLVQSSDLIKSNRNDFERHAWLLRGISDLSFRDFGQTGSPKYQTHFSKLKSPYKWCHSILSFQIRWFVTSLFDCYLGMQVVRCTAHTPLEQNCCSYISYFSCGMNEKLIKYGLVKREYTLNICWTDLA